MYDNPYMSLLYKILRALIVILIAIAVTVPAMLYVGLSLPQVQRTVASVARDELSGRLGARVEIGSLTITPFNRALMRDITVTPENTTDTVMKIDRLGAGVSLYDLIVHRKTVINYVEIVGLDLHVTRDSANAPINIQPIIDKLSSTAPDKSNSNVTMAVSTVILRDTRLRYDILNQPQPVEKRFNVAHIDIYDMNADFLLPIVGNKGIDVKIKRFKASERSGLKIDNITGGFTLLPDSISWNDVTVNLPNSHIALRNFSMNITADTTGAPFIARQPVNLSTEAPSTVTPADLSPICPFLAHLDTPVKFQASINGMLSDESHVVLQAYSPTGDFDFDAKGTLYRPLDSINRSIKSLDLKGHLGADAVVKLAEGDKRIVEMAMMAQYVDIDMQLAACNKDAGSTIRLSSAAGDADIKVAVTALNTRSPHFTLETRLTDIHLGQILQDTRFDLVTLDVKADGKMAGKRPIGKLQFAIDHFDWQGHPLGDITGYMATGAKEYELAVSSLDPAARFSLEASGIYKAGRPDKSIRLLSTVERIDLGELFPGNKMGNAAVTLTASADLTGSDIDNIEGRVAVDGINVERQSAPNITINNITMSASTTPLGERCINLESDVISGNATGDIYLSTLMEQIKKVSLVSLPSLLDESAATLTTGRIHHRRQRPLPPRLNNFSCQLKIHDTEEWADAMRLPLSILGESTIDYALDAELNSMHLCLYAPYLRQGKKLIEETRLDASITGTDSVSNVIFTTCVPTQHGPLTLNFDSNALDNTVNTSINWNIDRQARYDGQLSFTTRMSQSPRGLEVAATINPGQLTFNDSTWTIDRATVDIQPGTVSINGINAHRSGQFVRIDGTASSLPDDAISIDLLGVNLDYIFESLGIDKVMLGGDATGCFYASNLFSREPRLTTPGLRVKDISYNKVVLGDAVVKSEWDNDNRAITLDAVVKPKDGPETFIDGAIYPLNDSLDITFDAHDVNVAFMYPYMSAFAADVSGRASGVARLWGNFKYIDMEGDLKGDNLKIKIDFTHTTYSTSDSVKLRLGEITLKDVTIHDVNGHKAKLNGKVWHKYFKEPVFDFNITDAHDFLVYDESSAQNPDWYGRIYGNGTAHISGQPGVVDIGVTMTTAPGSVFTFVLNDRQDASDYTFITFRDRDMLQGDIDNRQESDDTPGSVKRLREMLSKKQEESASSYNIDLGIFITPDASINLVMDPVAGDRIRSRGNGDLHITYSSRNNDFHMLGSYKLAQGNYNFTLQDIFLKEFIIKEGSEISFSGDPFNAQIAIKAAYPLTANLLDLDQSFQQDKDLNRTTVPVNAILNVNGSLLQNEITFDLEFPTLTEDTYRKVRSIVSTDDMMKRQIIYLLALNRFYTPDYMAASRGNELMSVASSTLSSQLSNILGSLSDNWNIAPTFRSDRGDFSDVEVDVALSSSLLNNRLLFNGNLGYRDKSLNNTQFVGDFDIEYLLNRAGTLRLKAYNRYNDMNYYVRTAETTQGVGVSFRRNFDNLRELINFHKRRQRDKTVAEGEPVQ